MFTVITMNKTYVNTAICYICTKSMQLLELYLKEKSNLFYLINLLHFKVRF